MKDDDTLERAMQALRDGMDGSNASAHRTRAQILARLQQSARRRRRAGLVLLPMAAAFTVTAAWGAVTGQLIHWVERVIGRPPVHLPSVERAPPIPTGPTRTSPTASAESTIEPAPQVDPDEERGLAAASSGVAPQSSTSPPVSRTISDREQSLYAAAHRAHFVAQDAASALRGWAAYLAAYPDGRFALEARYNRAISLVRLGRRSEARAALEPFASGDTGGYRQREARELLDALR
jgi:TolA-binding protein